MSFVIHRLLRLGSRVIAGERSHLSRAKGGKRSRSLLRGNSPPLPPRDGILTPNHPSLCAAAAATPQPVGESRCRRSPNPCQLKEMFDPVQLSPRIIGK